MKPYTVVIVGGGSAGWMSATYLQKLFVEYEQPFEIKIIEPMDIPSIGVGEATIPTILDFFQLIDIPEVELLIKSDASIKSAIKFVDWHTKSTSYYHPFESPILHDGLSITEHWLSLAQSANQTIEPYAAATGLVAKLCDDNLILKSTSELDYSASAAYAYHLDAVKMANHLKDIAIERGATLISDKCVGVTRRPNGDIESVHTEQSGVVEGDLFIDCSGQPGRLIKQELGSGFKPYKGLLTNSAVAIRTAKQEGPDSRLRCYTTATAMPHGWIWEIDLPTRTGNGYVYSDASLSKQQAEDDLVSFLGEHKHIENVSHLEFTPGRVDEFWKQNCIAIGLSGGFIEPLESTGLQLIDNGLRMLGEYFPYMQNSDKSVLRQQYNTKMQEQYDEASDFVQLHYLLSDRADSEFWNNARAKEHVSEQLKNRMQLWKHKLPSYPDFDKQSIFTYYNYLYILLGMDHTMLAEPLSSKPINTSRSQMMMKQMQDYQNQAKNRAIVHEDFITRVRAPFGL